ncbi:uncharacterized protein F5Z01DRAFT_128754 [Emericellopsis atlantica]|uniref:Uncharacterized protein n=1 Tax=Emericellopsis atlantica TaxID=2614577 RepID=A0A9P7ZKV0_9HYPO|nr:uncharacterized protein F5Z01DRAFT_128754 [Emericellopsis atlantica]KAG9253796.1 hypothetical protein F5Z01DRAFT_128754 [Emericellopsis atlantica]
MDGKTLPCGGRGKSRAGVMVLTSSVDNPPQVWGHRRRRCIQGLYRQAALIPGTSTWTAAVKPPQGGVVRLRHLLGPLSQAPGATQGRASTAGALHWEMPQGPQVGCGCGCKWWYVHLMTARRTNIQSIHSRMGWTDCLWIERCPSCPSQRPVCLAANVSSPPEPEPSSTLVCTSTSASMTRAVGSQTAAAAVVAAVAAQSSPVQSSLRAQHPSLRPPIALSV